MCNIKARYNQTSPLEGASQMKSRGLISSGGQGEKIKIIPPQMEVAPLHCTVDITQKRRLFKNTKETEKM